MRGIELLFLVLSIEANTNISRVVRQAEGPCCSSITVSTGSEDFASQHPELLGNIRSHNR